MTLPPVQKAKSEAPTPFRVAIVGGVVAILVWVRCGPLPSGLLDRSAASTAVLDRNGVVLYETLGADGTRGERLRSDSLPPNLVRATVAAEDRRFFSHPGVDPIAIARAMLRNVRRGGIVEGGSTITQQAAKMLLGNRERTLPNKIRETLVALRLEHRYSKRAILALYLNLAPYGNRISGAARASRSYFGCAPEALTPAQAAFLAALPQRPSAFNPRRDESAARARQLTILARMGENGAATERLRFASDAQPILARHFVERVLASSGDSPRRIRTTLDAGLQREVAGIIAAHKRRLLDHSAHSAAVVVLDNATGDWLAWEGSGDYFGAPFGGATDGATALRQPGSTLKPFTYALAFEQGASPATIVHDEPTQFPTAEPGIIYTPRNYDGVYRGPLRARVALAGSLNVPAVSMLARVTPATMLRFLRHTGFTDLRRTADYYGLGLTLGDAEVRLSQLVAAYAAFARGGLWVQPRMTPSDSQTVRRVFSPRTAFWITDILADSGAREFIFGSGGSLDFPFPAAVKTGTSQAYRDNWTIGYTREVTVGVWVGNFDRTEMRNSTGITGAGPIFHAVMLAAVKRARGNVLEEREILAPPPGLVRRPLCTLTGLRPSTLCQSIESEWIVAEEPVVFCSSHRDVREERETKVAEFRVVNPHDGATYMIDPTLRRSYQALSLKAEGGRRVSWYVNERKVGTGTKVPWPLVPGRHTIAAVNETGARHAVTIFVR